MVHGGKAPQNIKAAKKRLLELADPALSALDDIVNVGRKQSDDPSSVVVRAALGILDRTGLGPKQTIDILDGEETIPLEALSPKLRKALEKELEVWQKGEVLPK